MMCDGPRWHNSDPLQYKGSNSAPALSSLWRSIERLCREQTFCGSKEASAWEVALSDRVIAGKENHRFKS